MHGILEQGMVSDVRFQENPSSICQDSLIMKLATCIHGIGHGYMWLNSNNVAKSLKNCTTFHPSSLEKNCDNGVFMEYAL
jgi:hypothetical protein